MANYVCMYVIVGYAEKNVRNMNLYGAVYNSLRIYGFDHKLNIVMGR